MLIDFCGNLQKKRQHNPLMVFILMIVSDLCLGFEWCYFCVKCVSGARNNGLVWLLAMCQANNEVG